MREYDSAVDDYLADLAGIKARHYVWIRAKNRDTGAEETLGLWNGLDSTTVTIEGESRTYTGAGALLGLDPIRASVGLDVRRHQISLSAIPPEVLQLIHGYDARLAPVEVHRGLFSLETNALVAEPHRILKGWIEEMPVTRPKKGESASVAITVASASRALTRTLTVKKSDAAQRTIDANDQGREYASISGAVAVFWNKRQAGAPPPSAPSSRPVEERDWNQR